jgi:hypothetical protein
MIRPGDPVLHNRNLPLRPIVHQTVDNADSGKTRDRNAVLWAGSLCLCLLRTASAWPCWNFKRHSAECEWTPRTKRESDADSGRRFGRDLGCARSESASLCRTRLFSLGTCDLRTRWLSLCLCQLRRSLRRSPGVSTGLASSARRLDRVERACGNCCQTITSRIFQLHECRAWD